MQKLNYDQAYEITVLVNEAEQIKQIMSKALESMRIEGYDPQEGTHTTYHAYGKAISCVFVGLEMRLRQIDEELAALGVHNE